MQSSCPSKTLNLNFSLKTINSLSWAQTCLYAEILAKFRNTDNSSRKCYLESLLYIISWQVRTHLQASKMGLFFSLLFDSKWLQISCRDIHLFTRTLSYRWKKTITNSESSLCMAINFNSAFLLIMEASVSPPVWLTRTPLQHVLSLTKLYKSFHGNRRYC